MVLKSHGTGVSSVPLDMTKMSLPTLLTSKVAPDVMINTFFLIILLVLIFLQWFTQFDSHLFEDLYLFFFSAHPLLSFDWVLANAGELSQ